MATLKQIIDSGFFNDEHGNARVPVAGFPGDFTTIYTTKAPGLYPLVGVGPGGYSVQYDENGAIRPDIFDEPFNLVLTDEEIKNNSLLPPLSLSHSASRFAVVDSEADLLDEFDTLGEAENFACHCAECRNTIIKVTKTVLIGAPGIAVLMESEPVAGDGYEQMLADREQAAEAAVS
jgi:hypothetical protein